jgi:acyl-CoA thioester hydrolase
MIFAEVLIRVEFFDLDPMQVVWHGNYARFLEVARCELLNRIGYNYPQMSESGYLWPIVDMRIKYVGPALFGQRLRVVASLAEWENRLKIDYRIFDAETGAVLTKAHTIQVAVEAETKELCLESPPALTDKVRALT